MVSLLSDLTSATLAKTLDATAVRHKVIANNIANAETPGFKRSDVSFEDRLLAELNSPADDNSLESRLESIDPEVNEDTVTPARPDGNNVSMDKEMASMAKNSMQYEAIVQLMNLRGSMLKTAINEGRK